MKPYQRAFLELCVELDVLKFGNFTLKSGRQSPYFFNAGSFDSGQRLQHLGSAYATALVESKIQFNLLFGPAYKGIPLASASAIALAQEHRRDVPFAFDRKEAKDHGEGGQLVGAPMKGRRVVIVDDVISAGTSVRQSAELIDRAGAQLVAVMTALDRQERGLDRRSASQEISQDLGIPVLSIVTLDALVEYLALAPGDQAIRQKVMAYRAKYGVLG